MASITQEGQWEIGGLVLGYGTPYDIHNFDGLGATEIRNSDDVRPGDHGSYMGEDFLAAKTVIIEGEIIGQTAKEVQNARAALASVWRPKKGSEWVEPLKYRLPGHDEVRALKGRPRRIAFDTSTFTAGTRLGITLEYFAADPREYSNHIQSTLIPGATPTWGRKYNRTYNRTYDTGVSNPGSDIVGLINSGTFPSKPRFTIHGTILDPWIMKIDTGEILKINNDVTIGTFDQVEIDFENRTVKFNGADRYYWLDQSSSWWDIEPGVNYVRFGGSIPVNQNPYTMAYWQNAWL